MINFKMDMLMNIMKLNHNSQYKYTNESNEIE